jgi:nucleoside-diphosphate-sugar epimerase
VEELLKEGYEIVGLVKPHHNVERIKSQGVKVVRGFLTDPMSYEMEVPEGATVFHCYALSSGAKETEEVYMKVNAEGTKNLLDVCEKKKVSKVVHISSVSVIGPREEGEGAVTEETEARPQNYYGKSKLKAESYVKEFHEKTGVPVVVLRLSTLYGPRAHKGAAFYRLFKMVAKYPVQAMIDGGGHKYEFNFIKNVVSGVMLAKDSEKPFVIYNLGDVEKKNYRQVLKVIAKEVNSGAKFVTVPSIAFQPFAKVGDMIGKVKGKRFAFDTRTLKSLKGSWNTSYDKAIEELGFSQVYSLEEGVKETVEYMRKEGMI